MIATCYVSPDNYSSYDAATSIVYEELCQPEHIASVEPFVEEDQRFYRENLLMRHSYGLAYLKDGEINVSALILKVPLGQFADCQDTLETTSLLAKLANFEPHFSQRESQEDVIDWDYSIPAPAPRASGKIRVKLKYVGRSKPLQTEDFPPVNFPVIVY